MSLHSATERLDGLGVGVKRRFLNRQFHNDPVPGPQKPLLLGSAVIRRRCVVLAGSMSLRDECVAAILEHADGEAVRETL